jgi:RHS repeat-associated protein
VWLGDLPVATLRPNGAGGIAIFYIHADHLGTPRRISRPSDNAIVWRWDGDAFGTSDASEDPDGDTLAFTFNLRFPGQYFDRESGRHYNYFRDYDPAIGRYIQSDPIGLQGGINTYAYVESDPINSDDPYGLRSPMRLPPRVEEHNRWTDPNRQLRRQFPWEQSVLPVAPRKYCFTVCAEPLTCQMPRSALGISIPWEPGCYMRCSYGPFLSPPSSIPEETWPPPPRDMTRGDWLDLIRLLGSRGR